jgi:hypothetical protein
MLQQLSSPEKETSIPSDDHVQFNPLHDHESVWWIVCWALLHYVPANYTSENDKILRKRVDFVRRLFHPTVFAPERYEVLLYGLPQSVIVDILDTFECLTHAVSVMRDSLLHHYQMAEAVPGSINEKAFDGLWQDLYTAYKMLAEKFEGLEVKIVDLKVEKRKFDETAGDDWDANDESPYKRERFDLKQ